jgi:hypothetical protein
MRRGAAISGMPGSKKPKVQVSLMAFNSTCAKNKKSPKGEYSPKRHKLRH